MNYGGCMEGDAVCNNNNNLEYEKKKIQCKR